MHDHFFIISVSGIRLLLFLRWFFRLRVIWILLKKSGSGFRFRFGFVFPFWIK